MIVILATAATQPHSSPSLEGNFERMAVCHVRRFSFRYTLNKDIFETIGPDRCLPFGDIGTAAEASPSVSLHAFHSLPTKIDNVHDEKLAMTLRTADRMKELSRCRSITCGPRLDTIVPGCWDANITKR